jgi:hypothetical protein
MDKVQIVRFAFEDPADLNAWELVAGQNPLEHSWTVEDGVLKIGESTWNSIARIRGMQFESGYVQYRIRMVGPVRPGFRFEVGAGYRLGDMPRDAEQFDMPPGFYVHHYSAEAWARTGGLAWGFRNAPPLKGLAREGPIPRWNGRPTGAWHTVRIEALGDEHRVFIARRGPLEPFIRVSGADQAIYDDGAATPYVVWAGQEWYEDRPLLQGAGGVGILYFMEGTQAGNEIHIDDFIVDTAWPVEPSGKRATTWGSLKSARVAR